jgi:hypothetical protein
MRSTEDDADLMLVSVGFGESKCPSPTSAPSPALVVAPILVPTRLPALVLTASDIILLASGTLTPNPGSAVATAADGTTGSTLMPANLSTTSPTTRGPTNQSSAPKQVNVQTSRVWLPATEKSPAKVLSEKWWERVRLILRESIEQVLRRLVSPSCSRLL